MDAMPDFVRGKRIESANTTHTGGLPVRLCRLYIAIRQMVLTGAGHDGASDSVRVTLKRLFTRFSRERTANERLQGRIPVSHQG